MEGDGVAPVKIPLLEKLARAYTQVRDERMQTLKDEIDAKQELIEAMHKNSERIKTPSGVLMYHYDDEVITLEPGKEKLKVAKSHLEDEVS